MKDPAHRFPAVGFGSSVNPPQLQVLPNRQFPEEFPALRDLNESPLDDFICPGPVDGIALKQDGSLFRPDQTADGFHQGGFSDPVAADDRNHLPFDHGEGNILENTDVTVINVDPANLKQDCNPPPDRPQPLSRCAQ